MVGVLFDLFKNWNRYSFCLKNARALKLSDIIFIAKVHIFNRNKNISNTLGSIHKKVTFKSILKKCRKTVFDQIPFYSAQMKVNFVLFLFLFSFFFNCSQEVKLFENNVRSRNQQLLVMFQNMRSLPNTDLGNQIWPLWPSRSCSNWKIPFLDPNFGKYLRQFLTNRIASGCIR